MYIPSMLSWKHLEDVATKMNGNEVQRHSQKGAKEAPDGLGGHSQKCHLEQDDLGPGKAALQGKHKDKKTRYPVWAD